MHASPASSILSICVMCILHFYSCHWKVGAEGVIICTKHTNKDSWEVLQGEEESSELLDT